MDLGAFDDEMLQNWVNSTENAKNEKEIMDNNTGDEVHEENTQTNSYNHSNTNSTAPNGIEIIHKVNSWTLPQQIRDQRPCYVRTCHGKFERYRQNLKPGLWVRSCSAHLRSKAILDSSSCSICAGENDDGPLTTYSNGNQTFYLCKACAEDQEFQLSYFKFHEVIDNDGFTFISSTGPLSLPVPLTPEQEDAEKETKKTKPEYKSKRPIRGVKRQRDLSPPLPPAKVQTTKPKGNFPYKPRSKTSVTPRTRSSIQTSTPSSTSTIISTASSPVNETETNSNTSILKANDINSGTITIKIESNSESTYKDNQARVKQLMKYIEWIQGWSELLAQEYILRIFFEEERINFVEALLQWGELHEEAIPMIAALLNKWRHESSHNTYTHSKSAT